MEFLLGTQRHSGEPLHLPQKVINRHIGLVGQTGSGKTVGLKVFIEEIALAGIPSVIVDPQGDLSQFILGVDEEGVAAGGGDLERARSFGDNTEVRVWTPVRSKGLPLCLNPFVAPSDSLDEEQLISSWDLMAAGFTSIAGFNLAKPEGAEIKAYLVSLIELADKGNALPKNFHQLADYVESPDRLRKFSGLEQGVFDSRVTNLIPNTSRDKLARRFRGQETGVNHLLFTLGTPLDFDTMATPCSAGKTPINIIYLNTLASQDLKDNFLLEIGRRLYDWTIRQKPVGNETKLAFAIDEVHPFMPPYPKNPPPKAILEMLAKQGRKFGLSCIFATQNLASVDYKIFGQAQTLCIGKFERPQDIKKVKDLLSVGNAKNTLLADELPKMKSGSFQVVCNEAFTEPQQVQFRWLYSHHRSGTLSEDEIEEYISDDMRLCIEAISKGEKMDLGPANSEEDSQRIGEHLTEDKTDENEDLNEERGESQTKNEHVEINDNTEHEVDDSFEMQLMGGFTLLKDSKDPLSVMLGTTNILTTLVLMWTSYHVGVYSMTNSVVEIPLLVGIAISMMAAGVLISEVLADGELAMVQKIRKRARPLQYFSLMWLWVLWFMLHSEMIPLPELITPVEIVQTMMTAFVLLEMSHRLRIGSIMLPKGNTLSSLFTSSVQSIKTVVTTTELKQLRNSSEQLFATFRLVLDGIVVMTLLALVSPYLQGSYLVTDAWHTRLLSIYSILLISQLVSRTRNSQQ
jgi:hypothetical protein